MDTVFVRHDTNTTRFNPVTRNHTTVQWLVLSGEHTYPHYHCEGSIRVNGLWQPRDRGEFLPVHQQKPVQEAIHGSITIDGCKDGSARAFPPLTTAKVYSLNPRHFVATNATNACFAEHIQTIFLTSCGEVQARGLCWELE
jgi:hypothetical protein